MVKVYYNRIITNQIEFSDVPSELKSRVKAYALECVNTGKLSEEAYDRYFGVGE